MAARTQTSYKRVRYRRAVIIIPIRSMATNPMPYSKYTITSSEEPGSPLCSARFTNKTTWRS